MRIEAAQIEALKSQRDALIRQAEEVLESGMSDELQGNADLEKAYETAGMALVLDAEDKEALLLRAEAANELAKFHARLDEWEVVEMWIKKLRATQLLPKELAAREWQLRFKVKKPPG